MQQILVNHAKSHRLKNSPSSKQKTWVLSPQISDKYQRPQWPNVHQILHDYWTSQISNKQTSSSFQSCCKACLNPPFYKLDCIFILVVKSSKKRDSAFSFRDKIFSLQKIKFVYPCNCSYFCFNWDVFISNRSITNYVSHLRYDYKNAEVYVNFKSSGNFERRVIDQNDRTSENATFLGKRKCCQYQHLMGVRFANYFGQFTSTRTLTNKGLLTK